MADKKKKITSRVRSRQTIVDAVAVKSCTIREGRLRTGQKFECTEARLGVLIKKGLARPYKYIGFVQGTAEKRAKIAAAKEKKSGGKSKKKSAPKPKNKSTAPAKDKASKPAADNSTAPEKEQTSPAPDDKATE